jgi:hypothetical protein
VTFEASADRIFEEIESFGVAAADPVGASMS